MKIFRDTQPHNRLGDESGNTSAVKPKGYVSEPRLMVNVAKRSKQSEPSGEAGSVSLPSKLRGGGDVLTASPVYGGAT